jgi:hypothetical protein
VSTLVAGVRAAAGHPSGPQTATDTGLAIDTSLATSAGHQPSGGRSFRKQRTGQSADGSGSLELPLLFLKAGPAGGRLAAAVLGRQTPACPLDRRVISPILAGHCR